MGLLLERSPVSLWTLLDLMLGALDAQLHTDLFPGGISDMSGRVRNSEIVVFIAYVLYCIAWFAVRFVRDPLPIWESTVQVHPEIRAALMIVDGAGLIAFLALAAGGVPMLFVTLRNAWLERNLGILGLFALPPAAVLTLAVYAGLAAGAWTERASVGSQREVFTPLALALQLGLVLIVFTAIGSSAAAIALAISRSRYSERLLRYALAPASVVTAGIAVGLAGTLALTFLIRSEAPRLGISDVEVLGIGLFMIASVALSISALQRGWRAARASRA